MVGKRVVINDALSQYTPLCGTVVSGPSEGGYCDVKHDLGGFIIRPVSKLAELRCVVRCWQCGIIPTEEVKPNPKCVVEAQDGSWWTQDPPYWWWRYTCAGCEKELKESASELKLLPTPTPPLALIKRIFTAQRISMGMFEKPGTWTLSSESDPRWNASGRAKVLMFTAGIPRECQAKIDELKKQLGEPPDDLRWEGLKD